jgi:hypothetical protein
MRCVVRQRQPNENPRSHAMLTSAHAVNAGPSVTYHHLAAVASRHDVILAAFAGPDPSEWKALDDVRALDIDVRAVWRLIPPRMMRRAPRVLPEHEVGDGGEQPSLQEPSWIRRSLRSLRKGEARLSRVTCRRSGELQSDPSHPLSVTAGRSM